jgi:hypothetical protein
MAKCFDLLDLHQHQERLMAQLTHVSSTGSLVMFSAPRVTSQQEVLWYGLYANVLWFAVTVVVKIFGKRFTS